MNSYELALTTPSRWRVYQFHHLGPEASNLAGVGGFEPPTDGFGDRCSTRLSYTPTSIIYFSIIYGKGYSSYNVRQKYST